MIKADFDPGTFHTTSEPMGPIFHNNLEPGPFFKSTLLLEHIVNILLGAVCKFVYIMVRDHNTLKMSDKNHTGDATTPIGGPGLHHFVKYIFISFVNIIQLYRDFKGDASFTI